MRKLVIGNDLDRTSVLNLDLLRGRLRLLYRVIKRPTVASDRKIMHLLSVWCYGTDFSHTPLPQVRTQFALQDLYPLMSAKCSGKILNRAFNEFHLIKDSDLGNRIYRLQRRYPLARLPKFSLTLRVFYATFSRNDAGEPTVHMTCNISTKTTLDLANYCTALIRKHVPEKYLKRHPRLGWQR